MNETDFFLSDVPLEHLMINQAFIYSCLGHVGKISQIDTITVGAFPDIFLKIDWESEIPMSSYVKWPEECDKLKVDLSQFKKMCKPYCDAEIARLAKLREFYEKVSQ